MATQNINIVISQTGGVTVVRNIQQIGQAAVDAINPLARLQNQINAVMGALAIRQLAQWADEWTAAANKVAVFAKNQAETNEVLERLYTVANKVGQPLNGVVDLYHKLSIQSKTLGVSTNENIQFTENISKALAIQGTSAATARGTLLQLSQAMGTGKVKAQEYNSLLTGAPLILKLVAENVDKAAGSVARLTAMQRAGELSSRMLYDGVAAATKKLDDMWAKSTRTFEQGWEVIVNGISRFLGKLNEATGASNAFYKASMFIANNLDMIAKVAAVIGVALLAAFAPAIITAFAAALVTAAGALATVSALLLANPFVLIAAATAAVILFGDSWNAGIDNITTVKDVFRALVEYITEAWGAVAEVLKTAWDMFVSDAQTAYDTISGKTADATGDWTNQYAAFFDDTGTGFAGWVTKIAKVMDAIAGLITGVIIGIGRAFGGLPEVIGQVFARVYNEIAGWMEKATNVVIDGINQIRSKVGAGLLDTVKFEKMNINKTVFSDYGENIAASVDEGFAIQGGYMVDKVTKLFDRAAAIGKTRAAAAKLAANSGVNLDERTDPDDIQGKGKKGKTKKDNSLEKLQNELRTLLNKIDPASGALLEMAKAQETLNKAVERGLITEAERQRYLPLLAQHYRDVIDPLGKYIRELNEEMDLLKVSSRERGVEATLMKMKQDLLMKGQPMNDTQIAQMRSMLQLQRDLNEATAIRDQLKSGSGAEADRTFALQLEQMKAMKAGGDLTGNDTTKKLAGDMPDLFAGTQEALDLRVSQFQDMYTKIDQMRQAEVISEQTASQMKLKVAAMESEQRFAASSAMFGQLASLQNSSNKKLAILGRAAAVSQVTIDGVVAVQKALASVPYPMNIAAAAAVGIQAAMNVAKIVSAPTAFATGGEFKVGGDGGVDSQLVAFRASPGEQVSVSTPTQVRHGTAGQQGGAAAAAPTFRPNIVNVLDQSVLASYMQSADGEAAVINIIQNNPSIVRNAASGGR